MTTAKRNSASGNPVRFRRSVMASACALALGGLAVGSAQAQSATHVMTYPGSQVFTTSFADKYQQNEQNESGALSATVTTVSTGATYVTSSVGGTPVTVTGNSSLASALGNLAANLIDPSLMLVSGGSAAIVSGQLRGTPTAAPVATTATQSGVVFGVVETAQAPATIGVSGNSTTAATQLNQATSTISGDLPNGYTATVPTGSVIAGYTTGGVNATATGQVAIMSQQAAVNAGQGAGSQATVDNSAVLIDLAATSGGLATSALTLTDNSIAATFGGNDATNAFAATGGSPSFRGAVALHNGQYNLENVSGLGSTAAVTGSGVFANITSSATPITTLEAALTVSNNAVSASSSGNTAGARSASGMVAGNSIVFQNVDVTGNSMPSLASMVSGGGMSGVLAGDLVLMNVQGNQSANLQSTVDGSGGGLPLPGIVTVLADTVAAGASITASGNRVQANGSGNLAGNLISASGSSFNATAAAANSQANDSMDATAAVNAGSIGVNVGSAGSVLGAITASGNRVAGSAEGNVAATTVALSATNLTTGPAGAVQIRANTSGDGDVFSIAGATAVNQQGNYNGGQVSGTVSNTAITVDVRDQVSLVPAALSATVNLTGNSIEAAGTGNTAATGVTLSASNGNASAGVGNTQVNGSLVVGQSTDSGIRVTAGTATLGTVNLTGNSVASSGTANDASNSINIVASNLTAAAAGVGAGSSASYDAAGTATSSAAYGIASSQRNAGSLQVTTQNTLPASARGSFAAIHAGDGVGASVGVEASTLTASNNAVSAASVGNRVGNVLDLSTSVLETAGNAAISVASIANSQANTATVDSATVEGGASGLTAVGISYYDRVGASTLTASANKVTASTVGNTAGNRLTATGGDLSSNAPLAASGTISAAAGTVQNEFAIANIQTDSVAGGRTALVNSTTVGISNSGNVAGVNDSTLTVDGNSIAAQARNNNASNALELDGFSTLNTGAGVLNQQSSATAVTANAQDGRVRIRVAGSNGTPAVITDTDLTLTGNSVQALAVGSSAGNSIEAAAGSVSGNANNATSGVSFVPGSGDFGGTTVPAVSADYGVANAQVQTGNVTALSSTPVRIVLGPVSGAGGSTLSGGSATLTGNGIAAIAQATSAVNTLSLAADSGAAGLTGAIGSSQQGAGVVTATITGEYTGAVAATIDARTMTSTAVTAANNRITAAAGQNEAFNTQGVQGASIAGNGSGGATGIDFSVASSQSATGAVTARALPSQFGVMADAYALSNVSVADNAIQAVARSNNANSTLALDASSNVAATGIVSNSQSADGAPVTAAVGSAVIPTSVGVAGSNGSVVSPNFSNSTVTVAGNTLASQAGRNETVNALSVDGSTVSGGTGAPHGFVTTNTQQGNGITAASMDIGTIGVTAQSANSSPITVQGNAATASATANMARNSQALSAASSLTGSGAVINAQTTGNIVPGAVTASLTAGGVGVVNALGTSFGGTTVTVTDNQLTAAAGHNSASNALTADAGSLAGTAPAGGDVSFLVRSSQAADGAVSAAAGVASVGVISRNGGGTRFTVGGNSVDAAANSNTVANRVVLNAAGVAAGTAGVINTQAAAIGAVSAQVTSGAVGVGGVIGSSLGGVDVSVANNVLSADASRNLATNSLVASGAALNGGTAPAAVTSFGVSNTQSGGDDVSAAVSLGLVGVATQSAGGGSIGVVGNQAASLARVNAASNTLVLNADSGLTGSAQVSNSQTANPAAVTASTGGTVLQTASIGLAPAAGAGAFLGGTPVTVTGNSLAAQGSGNTALNGLEANAGSSIAASAAPTFAVLNTQANYASVSTTVAYADIGATSAFQGGVNATVGANQVTASAYGNTASNTLGMSRLAGGLNTASATVSNTQNNAAALSSSVVGVAIGVMSGTTGGGSTVVSGNSVVARTVGNSATNVITGR